MGMASALGDLGYQALVALLANHSHSCRIRYFGVEAAVRCCPAGMRGLGPVELDSRPPADVVAMVKLWAGREERRQQAKVVETAGMIGGS
jgi:hypothetical protein